MDNPYQLAAALAEAGKLEASWKILGEILNNNPDDLQGLVTGSYVLLRMGALPQAYHFARAATKIAPQEDAAWTNLGHAASQLWLVDEAEQCYLKALKCCRTKESQKILWLNLSALYLDNGQFDKSEQLTRKLLEFEPTRASALANLGFCQLARREWAEGWKNYRHTIGSIWRSKVRYKDEPEWDGSPGKNVVLYADQGLGDEILFASMIPDAAKACKKVILDCDGRLQGLFKRSFPQIKVYGTRVREEKWALEDREIDASLPLGQIGEFFRNSDEDFPGTAYLKACPDRMKMWRALFKDKDKPVIGIAWTGGVPKTGQRMRHCGLEEWLPLFNAVDAHWVCLQYKDAQSEIAAFLSKHPYVDLIQYPWATLTSDYDDTAALVASLDAVIGVPTSVIHLSGALGIKTFAMKAKISCWKYEAGLPFHPATLIEHRGTWKQTIQALIPQVKDHCASLSGMTPGSLSPTTFFSIPSSGTVPGPSALHR